MSVLVQRAERRSLAATVTPPGGVWTAEYLAFVLPLTPEQVLRVEGLQGGATHESRREWTWVQTAQRLAWAYGEAGALRRLNGYGVAA